MVGGYSQGGGGQPASKEGECPTPTPLNEPMVRVIVPYSSLVLGHSLMQGSPSLSYILLSTFT